MNYIIKQCTPTNLHYASIRPNLIVAKYTAYMVLVKISTKEDSEEEYAFVTKFYSIDFDPSA